MTDRVLTARALNRALLARQLLLERASLPIVDVIDQVGGLQTQYAPSGYVGLWTRIAGFGRASLTEALEDRSVIQGTLMRETIHMVSAREYWRFALGVREARRAWSLRLAGADARRNGVSPTREPAMLERALELRAALADGPRTVKELGSVAGGFVGHLGLWVDLVRVPPSGTWERRRADRLALAEVWVGPEDSTEADGVAHLVRAYLRAFGPAPWRDIAAWAGISVTAAQVAAEARFELVRYRDEAGRELLDLRDASLPDPGTPAPVRFLPHWDAALLVHARRTGILPEAYRTTVFHTHDPFSVGTYLVDGYVAGAWRIRDGRVVLEPYATLDAAAAREVERERQALEAFHA
jgi:hypothetical protein